MKNTLFSLSLIFVVAYFLRVLYLPQNSLTFTYDQARDAFQAQNIISGDFKIQGPPSSTQGINHGVFWFYFLVPPNIISNGDPIVSAYWTAFFNAGVVILVFLLSKFMTKNSRVGIIAAFLYAISFEATQYATWLSNPTVGIWTVPLIYLGLWIWINSENLAIKGNKFNLGPLLTGLGLGLSIQANAFLVYHILPIFIWLYIARDKIKLSENFQFVVSAIVATLTIIISEFKFGFTSLSGLISLLSVQDSVVASRRLGDFVVLYINQLGDVFSRNIFPSNIGYGAGFIILLLLISLYKWKDKYHFSDKNIISWEPFLATWLLSSVAVVTVGGSSTPFLMVGIGPAISILVAIYIELWWSNGNKIVAIFIMLIILASNLQSIISENSKGQTIFALQSDMLLSKQLESIDYIYKNAEGDEFTVNSLTSPLWINIVWTYLFNWYGQDEYGYVPYWHGKGQEGQLDTLDKSNNTQSKVFLIIEPMGDTPSRYFNETLESENYYSRLIEEKNWGDLRVQYRERLKDE